VCTLPCAGQTWYASFLVGTLGPTVLVAAATAVRLLATRLHTYKASRATLAQGAAADELALPVVRAADSSAASGVAQQMSTLANFIVLLFFVPITSRVFQALHCEEQT